MLCHQPSCHDGAAHPCTPPPTGTTDQFTQAVSLAVTKYGADATAAAAALSTGSGGTVPPATLSSGNAQAAARAVQQGVQG